MQLLLFSYYILLFILLTFFTFFILLRIIHMQENKPCSSHFSQSISKWTINDRC